MVLFTVLLLPLLLLMLLLMLLSLKLLDMVIIRPATPVPPVHAYRPVSA
jgi:hypothetical protein